VKAHQAAIRDRLAKLDPRPQIESLAGCRVEKITVAEAKSIILRFEYLRSMPNRPLASYGLRAPDGDLLGAAVFGRGPGRLPAGTVILERGACVHYAPPNAASFLIRRACAQAHRDHDGWTEFRAYADPAAGEIGTVYQAVGWEYLGQGIGRQVPYREQWRRPGETVWRSDRVLRHLGLKKTEALALGWHHRRTAPKHVYRWIEGVTPGTRKTVSSVTSLPYPKRPSRRRARAERAIPTCLICAKPMKPTRYETTRADRKTCSARCRQRLSRSLRRAA
jgi:hypothetical protein